MKRQSHFTTVYHLIEYHFTSQMSIILRQNTHQKKVRIKPIFCTKSYFVWDITPIFVDFFRQISGQVSKLTYHINRRRKYRYVNIESVALLDVYLSADSLAGLCAVDIHHISGKRIRSFDITALILDVELV